MAAITTRSATACETPYKKTTNDAALQAAVSQATAATLLTFTDDRQTLKVINKADQGMTLCWGRTGKVFDYIEAGGSQTYDFSADQAVIPSGSTLCCYFDAAPANDTSHWVFAGMAV